MPFIKFLLKFLKLNLLTCDWFVQMGHMLCMQKNHAFNPLPFYTSYIL